MNSRAAPVVRAEGVVRLYKIASGSREYPRLPGYSACTYLIWPKAFETRNARSLEISRFFRIQQPGVNLS